MTTPAEEAALDKELRDLYPEAKLELIKPWMRKLLHTNPSYTGWGVNQDCMTTLHREGFEQSQIFETCTAKCRLCGCTALVRDKASPIGEALRGCPKWTDGGRA